MIIIDLVEERLNFAEKLGADETVNAGKVNAVERVRQLTGGYGADVVIEAIGLPCYMGASLKTCLERAEQS